MSIRYVVSKRVFGFDEKKAEKYKSSQFVNFDNLRKD